MTKKIKLNLGCGNKYLNDYINCDVSKNIKLDKKFSLNIFPYPFRESVADEVLMDNVLEHLDDITQVMEEVNRILKPNGLFKIIVPYFKSDWSAQDPTHKHFFTEKSMDYYSIDFEYNYYSSARYKIIKSELFTDNKSLRSKIRNLIPFRALLRNFLFNMYDGVYFELEAIK